MIHLSGLKRLMEESGNLNAHGAPTPWDGASWIPYRIFYDRLTRCVEQAQPIVEELCDADFGLTYFWLLSCGVFHPSALVRRTSIIALKQAPHWASIDDLWLGFNYYFLDRSCFDLARLMVAHSHLHQALMPDQLMLIKRRSMVELFSADLFNGLTLKSLHLIEGTELAHLASVFMNTEQAKAKTNTSLTARTIKDEKDILNSLLVMVLERVLIRPGRDLSELCFEVLQTLDSTAFRTSAHQLQTVIESSSHLSVQEGRVFPR